MKKRIISTIFAILIGLSLAQTASADSVYIVKAGDTLSNIALNYDGISWLDIARTNDIVNPNIIYIGQVLRIPDGATAPTPAPVSGNAQESYTVQAGDTLYRVAVNFGTTVDQLVSLNNITNRGIIYIGQVINLPDGSVAAAPTAVPVVVAPTATPVPPAPTAVPVQATAVPQQPTAVPPPPPTAVPQVVTGVNLLRNGSFENGHYNMNGVQELQLPVEWGFEWDEGPSGFGSESWDTWVRPETRVLGKPFIPPHEHDLFFFDGGVTIKIFKGFGVISARMFQDVDLQPGNYQLTIRAFPDMVTGYDGGKKYSPNAEAAEINAFAGGSATGFVPMVSGQKGEVRLNFTVDSAQRVRVGAGMRGRFALENNGFFVDHWELVRTN